MQQPKHARVIEVLSLQNDGLEKYYVCRLDDGRTEYILNPLTYGCTESEWPFPETEAAWKRYVSNLLEQCEGEGVGRLKAFFKIRDQYHPEPY